MDTQNNNSKKPSFEPSAERKILSHMLDKATVGDTISYNDMSESIGGNVRQGFISAMQGALKDQIKKGRIWANIRNVGYKLLNAVGVVNQSTAEVKRQHTASGRTLKKLASVEYLELPEPDRGQYTSVTAVCRMIRRATRQSEVKKLAITVGKTHQVELPLAKTLKHFLGETE